MRYMRYMRYKHYMRYMRYIFSHASRTEAKKYRTHSFIKYVRYMHYILFLASVTCVICIDALPCDGVPKGSSQTGSMGVMADTSMAPTVTLAQAVTDRQKQEHHMTSQERTLGTRGKKPMPTDGTFLFLRETPLTAEKNAYSINYQVTGGFCFLSSSVRRMSRNCWKETSPIMICSNISSGFISPDL